MKYLTNSYVKHLEEKRADDVERITADEVKFEDATYFRESDGKAYVRADVEGQVT